jgi:hypothetical protein
MLVGGVCLIRYATKFLERAAFFAYAPDILKLGSTVDTVLRRNVQVLAERSPGLGPEGLHHIVYCDLSKLGRCSQTQINECMEFAHDIMERSPLKSVLVLLPPLLPSAGVPGLRGEARRRTHNARP